MSKLARPVDLHAKRLQVQERFTSQVADAVQDRLEAVSVIVVVRAEHLCMATLAASLVSDLFAHRERAQHRRVPG